MIGEIVHLFPTPLWIGKTTFDLSDIREKCLEMEKNDEGRLMSNRGGYQSNDIDFSIEPFLHVKNILEEAAKEAANEWFKDSQIGICNGWINVNRKNHYNNKHCHPGSSLSAVLYVDVPENSGKIFFHRDDAKEYFNVPHKNSLGCMHDWVSFKPHTGCVFVFPAWLMHEVAANEVDEPRISIAVNVSVIDERFADSGS